MLRTLRIYTLRIPLTYNTYSIDSPRSDTQLIMGLDQDISFTEVFPVHELIPDGTPFHSQAIWRISITCGQEEGMDVLPRREFFLHIDGIAAHSQEEAGEMLQPFLHRVCRSLSMMITRANGNKHLFQPRVEPQYSRAEWAHRAWEEYDRAVGCEERERTVDSVDGEGNRYIEMYASFGIAAQVSCETTIYGKLPAGDFAKYYRVGNEAMEYLLQEYYTALGQENVKSKFFHLFSIIEFIEREYVHLSGAVKLYAPEEVGRIKSALAGVFPEEPDRQSRLESAILQRVKDITDIGREQKLVNILRGMGIHAFEEWGNVIEIQREDIRQIIRKRNDFFHGICKSREKEGISVERAVARLMGICPGIIAYVADHEPSCLD